MRSPRPNVRSLWVATSPQKEGPDCNDCAQWTSPVAVPIYSQSGPRRRRGRRASLSLEPEQVRHKREETLHLLRHGIVRNFDLMEDPCLPFEDFYLTACSSVVPFAPGLRYGGIFLHSLTATGNLFAMRVVRRRKCHFCLHVSCCLCSAIQLTILTLTAQQLTVNGIDHAPCAGIRFKKYEIVCHHCSYVPTKQEHVKAICARCQQPYGAVPT